MNYKLRHQSIYKYHNAVDNYQSIVCLQPLTLPHQLCWDFALKITPAPKKIYSRKDSWGNTQHHFSIHQSHTTLSIVSTSNVEVLPRIQVEQSTVTCHQAATMFKDTMELKNELLPFMLPSKFVYWDDEIRAFAQPCFIADNSYLDCVKRLNEHLFSTFEFNPEFSTVNTPLKTILKEKKGVCQDFSHLAIASLRSMGFAARYVSGYIETVPPHGKPKLQGSDASHAWISVYIPGAGWCEFDPTNNLIPGEQHITTAYGRDYEDIAPIKGIIYSSGSHSIEVKVDVTELPVLNRHKH